MNDLRNTYCSNLFKDSKATCEGQLRVMDSGRPSKPRLPQAQGLPWLNQPWQRPTFQDPETVPCW